MKTIFTQVALALLCTATIPGAFAQTSSNFNSLAEAQPAGVKAYLQHKGWAFSSPLKLNGNHQLTFRYSFNNTFASNTAESINIHLLNSAGTIETTIDQVNLSSVTEGQIYTYNRSFNNLPTGTYKFFIEYPNSDQSTMLVEDIQVNANIPYVNGSNSAPVGKNDFITGNADHIAGGNVLSNDTDPDYETLEASLLTNSPDGTVVMQSNGDFTFTPKPGFTGNTTSFTYAACDNGYPALCSSPVTVKLSFPVSAIIPASLVNLEANYLTNGKVEISFSTTFEQNMDRFEILRSLNDGEKWEVAGSLEGAIHSTVKKDYQFMDDVGKNTALKKDLYYRLKQVDQSGKVAYSGILVVRVYNTHSVKTVSVSPNPVKNDIAVQLQLKENSYATMKILGGNGTEIMRKSTHVPVGNSLHTMEGSSRLKPGPYFLEVIINSKERMIVKLIKE